MCSNVRKGDFDDKIGIMEWIIIFVDNSGESLTNLT